MDFEHSTSPELAAQTAAIVAAYVSNNHIAATELPAIIASVHGTLAQIAAGPVATVAAERLVPAVAIKNLSPMSSSSAWRTASDSNHSGGTSAPSST